MSPNSESIQSTDLIRRRELLSLAGATAIGAMVGLPRGYSDESAKQPLIGFSLYGMKSLPTVEALRICSEIGYECVELAAMADWPCAPEKLSIETRQELKQQLSDRGLKLAAIMENLPLAVDGDAHRNNLERLRLAMQLARDLAPNQMPLIETVLGGSPDKWPMLKDKFIDRLRDWARVAVENDSIIAIKAHIAGALHLPQDVADVAKTIDSKGVQLTFDFSHFQLRDCVLKEAWQAMAERTRFVHVKDGAGKPGAFQFLLPGEGTIDYVELFRLLNASRYTGAVVVEVSAQISGKPSYDPLAAAKKCWLVLRDARAQAVRSKG